MLSKLLELPKWAYLVIAAVIVAALIGWVQYIKHEARNEGRAEVQQKWDASVERGKKIVADLREKAGKVTVRTEIEYRDREKVIYAQGREREVVRTVFVPTDSGMLSGGFRLYHDAAATNGIPDPAGIPNAAPVPVADVADTIDANYEKAHVCYATVEAWQKWAREQCKLNEKGCPDGGQ